MTSWFRSVLESVYSSDLCGIYKMSKSISRSVVWIIHESDLNWVHHKPFQGSHIICSHTLSEFQISVSWVRPVVYSSYSGFYLGCWTSFIALKNSGAQHDFREQAGVKWLCFLQGTRHYEWFYSGFSSVLVKA